MPAANIRACCLAWVLLLLPVAAPEGARAAGDTLHLLWSDGSCGADDRPDTHCNSLSPPPVFERLAKQGLGAWKVRLDTGVPRDVAGGYVEDNRWKGAPKVCARAERLAAYIDAKYAGVPRERIFLAGISAGAWASLLVQRAYPGKVNGVIAFAPAFAHQRKNRAGAEGGRTFAAKWRSMRERHVAHLESVPPPPGGGAVALLFQFHCDSFEWPQELALVNPNNRRVVFPAFAGAVGCCENESRYPAPQLCRSEPGNLSLAPQPCCLPKTVANCPAGFEKACESVSHTELYAGAAFDAAHAATVTQFLEERIAAAGLPADSPADGRACAFLAGP